MFYLKIKKIIKNKESVREEGGKLPQGRVSYAEIKVFHFFYSLTTNFKNGTI